MIKLSTNRIPVSLQLGLFNGTCTPRYSMNVLHIYEMETEIRSVVCVSTIHSPAIFYFLPSSKLIFSITSSSHWMHVNVGDIVSFF